MDALRQALAWARDAELACERGVCSLSMDVLIVAGVRHLMNADACEKLEVSPGIPLLLPDAARERISALHQWIGRWRAAADEAEKLGLGRNIPYDYWQQNIQLPEALIVARKWFETAEKLADSNAMDTTQLKKLISDAGLHVVAVAGCQSSWPQARRLSIERRLHWWGLLVAHWAHKVRFLLLENARKENNVKNIKIRTQEFFMTCENVKNCNDIIFQSKKKRRAIRAKMRKKRTCCHCGKTAPLSEISFAYCGGCRDSGVPRKHWMRYCSEACQRAHWHAGHKDVCPLLCSFSFAPGDK